MRVLITGGHGFVGTALRQHFHEANGHPGAIDGVLAAAHGVEPHAYQKRLPWQVVSLDRAPPKETFPGQQEERCDLLDYENLESVMRWANPDAVLHIAAQARVEPSIQDPLGTYELNVQASLNVMRACQRTKVKHLVAASSEAIYGAARKYPSAENDDFLPINPYAASKASMDMMVQQFNRVLPTCVVRSGMGWGPRSSPKEQVVAKFITKALNDQDLLFPRHHQLRFDFMDAQACAQTSPIPYDGVTPTRDLNFVEDFCRGVQRVVEAKARGVYNLSGGREYTVLEIARRIIAAVGKGRIRFTRDYSWREGESGFRTWLDNAKATRELGHTPKHHLQGDALTRTIEWYRTHPNYWD